MNLKSLLFFLLLFACLIIRIYFYLNTPKTFREGDLVRITAKMSSEPIRYQESQYFKIKGLKVYLPLYPEVYYGDNLVIEGTVEKDKLKNPKLMSLSGSSNLLYRLRKKMIAFFKSVLPEPHSSLVAGVTIGAKGSIPEDFWETLKKTGTAHVVVASGMNVSLIGEFLINFWVIFFKRKRALLFALAGIWIYAVISGFEAPIVRASVMGSVAFTAQELGKLNASLRALAISGIVMTFINPGYLSDLGFWLSFLATLSILLFEFRIRKKINFVPEFLRQNLSTSISAQIGVAPLLFYYFGQFNFLSPLINVLIIWTIVPITLLGMIAGLVGLIFGPIGTLILFLAYPFTFWFVWVTRLFS